MTTESKHRILIAVGSIILFCSWLIENYIQKGRNSRLAESRDDVLSLQIIRSVLWSSKFAFEYYRDK